MSTTVIPGLGRLQRRSDNGYMAELEADVMPALTKLRLETTSTTYVGRKGDLVCFLTDLETGPRKREATLLMTNRRDPQNRHVHVLLGQLWLLLDPVLYRLDGAVDQAKTERAQRAQQQALLAMTERLYGFVTQQDSIRVLDALFDFAEDLKNAKPPRGFSLGQWLQALAEDDMTLTFNGQAMSG